MARAGCALTTGDAQLIRSFGLYRYRHCAEGRELVVEAGAASRPHLIVGALVAAGSVAAHLSLGAPIELTAALCVMGAFIAGSALLASRSTTRIVFTDSEIVCGDPSEAGAKRWERARIAAVELRRPSRKGAVPYKGRRAPVPWRITLRDEYGEAFPVVLSLVDKDEAVALAEEVTDLLGTKLDRDPAAR